jgi:hypothetical protein
MHIVAREGTPMEDLPEAKVARSSDLVPALQRRGDRFRPFLFDRIGVPGLGIVIETGSGARSCFHSSVG